MTPELIAQCTGARIDRARTYAPCLTAAMAEFGIDTPKRQAAFLAQVGHETGGLRWMVELWGAVATPAQAKYEPPSDLATALGNTQTGDGYRYRGRGALQLTGRANYRKAGPAIGADLEAFPDLAAEPLMACRIAGWFWQTHGLNALADADQFTTITKRINGGTNGLAQRIAIWNGAKLALGVA